MLLRVTDRVDCFGGGGGGGLPDSEIKYSVFYVYLRSCIILCYFTGLFYVVVRHICTNFIHRQ